MGNLLPPHPAPAAPTTAPAPSDTRLGAVLNVDGAGAPPTQPHPSTCLKCIQKRWFWLKPSRVTTAPTLPLLGVTSTHGDPRGHQEQDAAEQIPPRNQRSPISLGTLLGKMGTRCLSTGRRNWHGAINHNNSIWIRRNYFVVKSTGNKLSFKNTIIAGFSDFGLEARTLSPARIMVSKKHMILPPGPDSASEEQREGKLG